MLKCEFCECSNPDGTCKWETHCMRKDYCRAAIKRMSSVLKLQDKETLERLLIKR